MSFTIRNAKKEDAPAIAELWWEMMEAHEPYKEKFYKPKPKKAFLKIVENRIKKDLKKRNKMLLVAEKREVIGFVIGELEKELSERFKYDTRGAISELVVKKEHRGEGVGKALLETIMTKLKKKGAKLAYLLVDRRNRHAIKLYEKMGFKNVLYDMVSDL